MHSWTRSNFAFMQLDIPSGKFAGYIFDLDGTLIDTMPLHYRAWDEAMRRAGLNETLSEDLFYSLGGVPTRRVAELFSQHYGVALDADAVMQAKELLYLKYMPEARLIQPVVEFLKKIAPFYPHAIATGGTLDVVGPSLKASGLAPFFDIIITPLDVEPGRGKPAPDIFLTAAARMGVSPRDCLVFEDAEPGIQGALAAGMKVVRVPSRVV